MVSQSTPTVANPLAAPFACHEDHGVTVADSGAALGFLDRPLARLFVRTSQPPAPSNSALSTLEMVCSQIDADLMAVHHARGWFPPSTFRVLDPKPEWVTMLLLAVRPRRVALKEARRLREFIYDLSAHAVMDELLTPDDAADRFAALREAIVRQDCSLLRFATHRRLPNPYRVFNEASACDGVDDVLAMLTETMASLIRSGDPKRVDPVYWAPLLEFLGGRYSDQRASLAAHMCRSGLPPARLVEFLNDIQDGLLTESP